MGRNKQIILASASPRRKEILTLMGIPFRQVKSRVREDDMAGDAEKHVLHYSRLKAEAVGKKVKKGIVLGADTVVVYKKKIYGKPATKKEAVDMLKTLSNRVHKVITGLTVMDMGKGTRASGLEVTKVRFRKLSAAEIKRYVETGEPMDKAGAYGIQEKGCFLVKDIEGCYYNVVGLPVARLIQLLGKIGYSYN